MDILNISAWAAGIGDTTSRVPLVFERSVELDEPDGGGTRAMDLDKHLRACGRFEGVSCRTHYAYTVLPGDVRALGQCDELDAEDVGYSGASSGALESLPEEMRGLARAGTLRRVAFKLMELVWRCMASYSKSGPPKSRKSGQIAGRDAATRGERSPDVPADIMNFAMVRKHAYAEFPTHDAEAGSYEEQVVLPQQDDLFQRLLEAHMDVEQSDAVCESVPSGDAVWESDQEVMCMIEYVFNDGSTRREPLEVERVIADTFPEFVLSGEYEVSCITFHWLFRRAVPKGLLDNALVTLFQLVHEYGGFCRTRVGAWRGAVGKKRAASESVDADGDRPALDKTVYGRDVAMRQDLMREALKQSLSDGELCKISHDEFAALLQEATKNDGPQVVQVCKGRNVSFGSAQYRVDAEAWLSGESALARRPPRCAEQQSYRHWLHNLDTGGSHYTCPPGGRHNATGTGKRKTGTGGCDAMMWVRPPHVFLLECDAPVQCDETLDQTMRMLLGKNGFNSLFENLYPTLFGAEHCATRSDEQKLQQTIEWLDRKHFSRFSVDLSRVPKVYLRHAPTITFARVERRNYLPTTVYAVWAATSRHVASSEDDSMQASIDALRSNLHVRWDALHDALTKSDRALAKEVYMDVMCESATGRGETTATLTASTLSRIEQSGLLQQPDGSGVHILARGCTTDREFLADAGSADSASQTVVRMRHCARVFERQLRKRCAFLDKILHRVRAGGSLIRSEVGIASDEQTRLTAYLARENTPQRRFMLHYIRERSQGVRDRLGELMREAECAPAFMHVLRTAHRRDTLRAYCRFGRGAMAEVSSAQRVIARYVASTGLYAAKNRVRMSKMDPSMDTLSNIRAMLTMWYHSVYNCAMATTLDLLNVCALDASRLQFDLHTNVLLLGPDAVHKKTLLDRLQEIRIGGDTDGGSTTMEVGVGERWEAERSEGAMHNGTVRVYGEASADALLREDGRRRHKLLRLRKQMDYCQCGVRDDETEDVAADSPSHDASQPPQVYGRSGGEMVAVHVFAMSKPLAHIPVTLRERMFMVHVSEEKRAGPQLGEMLVDGPHDAGRHTAQDKARCTRVHHFVQAVKSELESLIYVGAMHDVSMDLFAMVYLFIEERMADKGVPFMTPRMIKLTRALVRTLCIQEVIMREFCFEGGVFCEEDVTPERIMKLEPMLVVRMNHVVVGLGMVMPLLFPREVAHTRSLLRTLYIRQLVRTGPTQVFKDAPALRPTRDQLISRGVFLYGGSAGARPRPGDGDMLRTGVRHVPDLQHTWPFEGRYKKQSSRQRQRQRYGVLAEGDEADDLLPEDLERAVCRFACNDEVGGRERAKRKLLREKADATPAVWRCESSSETTSFGSFDPSRPAAQFARTVLSHESGCALDESLFDTAMEESGLWQEFERRHLEAQTAEHDDCVSDKPGATAAASLRGGTMDASMSLASCGPKTGRLSQIAMPENPVPDEFIEYKCKDGRVMYYPMTRTDVSSFRSFVRLQNPAERLTHDLNAVTVGDATGGDGRFGATFRSALDEMQSQAEFVDCSMVEVDVRQFAVHRTTLAESLSELSATYDKASPAMNASQIDYALTLMRDMHVRARRYTVTTTIGTELILNAIAKPSTRVVSGESVEFSNAEDAEFDRAFSALQTEAQKQHVRYWSYSAAKRLACMVGMMDIRQRTLRGVISDETFVAKCGTLPHLGLMRTVYEHREIGPVAEKHRNRIKALENAFMQRFVSMDDYESVRTVEKVLARMYERDWSCEKAIRMRARQCLRIFEDFRKLPEVEQETARTDPAATMLPQPLGDEYHGPEDDVLYFDTRALASSNKTTATVPTHWVTCDEHGHVERMVCAGLDDFMARKAQTPMRCAWTASASNHALYDVVQFGRPRRADGVLDKTAERAPLYVSQLNTMTDVEQRLTTAHLAAPKTRERKPLYQHLLAQQAVKASKSNKDRSDSAESISSGGVAYVSSVESAAWGKADGTVMIMNMSAEMWAARRHSARCDLVVQNVSHALLALCIYGLEQLVQRADPRCAHRSRTMTAEAFRKLDYRSDRSFVHTDYRVLRPAVKGAALNDLSTDESGSDDDEVYGIRSVQQSVLYHSDGSRDGLDTEHSMDAHLAADRERRRVNEHGAGRVYHWKVLQRSGPVTAVARTSTTSTEYSVRERYLTTLCGMTPVVENRMDLWEVALHSTTIKYPTGLLQSNTGRRLAATLRRFNVEDMPSGTAETASDVIQVDENDVAEATDVVDTLTRQDVEMGAEPHEQRNTTDEFHDVVDAALRCVDRPSARLQVDRMRAEVAARTRPKPMQPDVVARCLEKANQAAMQRRRQREKQDEAESNESGETDKERERELDMDTNTTMQAEHREPPRLRDVLNLETVRPEVSINRRDWDTASDAGTADDTPIFSKKRKRTGRSRASASRHTAAEARPLAIDKELQARYESIVLNSEMHETVWLGFAT